MGYKAGHRGFWKGKHRDRGTILAIRKGKLEYTFTDRHKKNIQKGILEWWKERKRR